MSRYVYGALIHGAMMWAALAVGPRAEAQSLRSFCFGGNVNDGAGDVDFFAAITQGKVEARVVVRDPYHGKIILKNLSPTPLAVTLPDFLGARPVLAQQGFPFGTSSPQQQTSGQGLPQPVGGSPNSSNSGSGIFGNSVFNIAPEQVRIVDLKCFCLEQGKPNPRSGVPYELAPLAEVNDDPRLPELLAAYARGDVDREAAQAAVWHAANDLDWDDLAALSRKVALNAKQPLFNASQLRQAKAVVDAAEKALAAAAERAKAAAREKLVEAAKIRL